MQTKISLTTFFRYLASGVTAAAIHLAVFTLALINGAAPLVASIIGFCVANGANYLMQFYWTFDHHATHATAFPRYMGISTSGLLLNSVVFYILNETTPLPPVVCQVITIFFVFLSNYFLNASYSFSAPPSKEKRG